MNIIKSKRQIIKDYSGTPEKPARLKYGGDTEQNILFRNLNNVVIEGAEVAGFSVSGDILAGKDYAITFENCHNVRIERPRITGRPDESNRDTFADSVGNGLLIGPCCSSVSVIKPEIELVHVGICARGVGSVVEGGSVKLISGDHVQILADYCRVLGVALSWSIPCLSYEKWHCDLLQIFDPRFSVKNPLDVRMKGVIIAGNTFESWANKAVHRFCEVGQLLLFSDGIGEGFEVRENTLIGDHEITILLSPCDNSIIEDNEIILKSSETRPAVGFEDRKKYGVHSVGCRVQNNPVKYAAAEVENIFESRVESLRNLHAPAVTAADYAAAGERLGISIRLIKAVAAVESSGAGFLPDGSIKILFERHIMRRVCVEAGLDERQIGEALGAELFNKKGGGYKGKIAEYWRAKNAVQRMPRGVEPEQALSLVLSSCSGGEFQIMGFNAGMVGYESPLDMFEQFHKSAAEQLRAFCAFIEKTGLVDDLQAADKLLQAGKSARGPLGKFARGYNGKKHKQYDLKIIAEYERLSSEPRDFKPLVKSRTLQGGVISVTGTAGGVYGVTELIKSIDQIKKARDSAVSIADDLRGDLDEIKTEMDSAANHTNLVLIILLVALVVSNIGLIRSMWARLSDRWKGIH